MLTKTIDIQAAQSRFTELLSYVMDGAEITLTRDGMPIARITSVLQRPPVLDLAAIVAREDTGEPTPDDTWLGKLY